ncbi:Plant organelle RNA recognition domain - like 3 [Theobroma cacao]|nr:Plant organelle RNA recognition domain - like 3 [Theobroma cacao]
MATEEESIEQAAASRRERLRALKAAQELLSTPDEDSAQAAEDKTNETDEEKYTQNHNYVNVYMKWKKDPFFDSIVHIHKSIELKPIIQLKNFVAKDPNGCIPISAVSKRGLEFDISIKVARFLRQYPSVFEEFRGPEYNLPWFRLTPEAAEIDGEEKRVFDECKEDLKDRLKRFILMSKDKVLPLKIIKGMEWYLGLPEGFLEDSKGNLDESFRFMDMEDGLKGLAVESEGEKVLSTMQRNAMKNGVYFGGTMEGIEFPIFPSKGLRLRRKIEGWLNEFQKLPYVSPYEDFSHLDPNSDVAEKRVVGILHELLSLFVEHSAQRKKLLCLKKYLGLPQKVHKAFERHPHMFYLSFKNKTCTAILKEAYCGKSGLERHPLLGVRKKYIRLSQMTEQSFLCKWGDHVTLQAAADTLFHVHLPCLSFLFDSNRSMKFRNYVPHDIQLQEGKVAPPVLPKFEDPVEVAPPPSEDKEDPFVNIAPKKPNWDLRRDVQKKLDKLERRTQKAIYILMVDALINASVSLLSNKNRKNSWLKVEITLKTRIRSEVKDLLNHSDH